MSACQHRAAPKREMKVGLECHGSQGKALSQVTGGQPGRALHRERARPSAPLDGVPRCQVALVTNAPLVKLISVMPSFLLYLFGSHPIVHKILVVCVTSSQSFIVKKRMSNSEAFFWTSVSGGGRVCAASGLLGTHGRLLGTGHGAPSRRATERAGTERSPASRWGPGTGVRGRLPGDWHVLAAWTHGVKASFVRTRAGLLLNSHFLCLPCAVARRGSASDAAQFSLWFGCFPPCGLRRSLSCFFLHLTPALPPSPG